MAAAWFKNPQPGGFRIELNRAPLSAFSVKAAPMTGAGLPSYPTVRQGISPLARRRLVMRDILSVFPLTTGSALTYLVEKAPVPAVPGAGYQVAEGDVKAEISILTESKLATMKTIAAWSSASVQVLSDVLYLESFIENRLLYELAYVEERELLNGAGGPGQILGFLAVATAYDAARTQPEDTALDVVSHAQTQLAEADVYATAVVLNPRDAEALRLTKTTLGEYVWADSDATTAEGAALWGLSRW